jgi:AcrR family transcriptional regulator
MNDTGSSTRAALLDAATALFAARGYEGTSVREITARADANLGAVTYHFGSKAALFEAVLVRALDELGRAIAAAMAQGGTALDRVERAFRAHFSFLASHADLRGLAIQVFLRGAQMPPRARASLRGMVDGLAGVIVQGQREGSIRAGDPRVLTVAVMAPSIVLNVLREPLRVGPGIDLLESRRRRAVLDTLVKYLRSGLAPRGRGS